MQYPITSYQLVAAVEKYGFTNPDAKSIVHSLEGEGRIDLSGSMLNIRNPTDPDAQYLSGLCKEARGATAGHVGNFKIKEYLQLVLKKAAVHGGSRHK